MSYLPKKYRAKRRHPDIEILTDVVIGSRALSEIMMNFIGVFMWIAVGAVALHYWGGYQGEHQFQFVFAERQASIFDFGKLYAFRV